MKKFIETHDGILNINSIRFIKAEHLEEVSCLYAVDTKGERFVIIGASDEQHVERVYQHYVKELCID